VAAAGEAAVHIVEDSVEVLVLIGCQLHQKQQEATDTERNQNQEESQWISAVSVLQESVYFRWGQS
jgi:hypothetical protein